MKRVAILIAVSVLSCSSDTLEDKVLKGDVNATIELAGHYFIGSEGYPEDADRAVSLLLPLSEDGNIRAKHFLGVVAANLGDIESALCYFEAAAAEGHVQSYERAAAIYLGKPCSRESAGKAFDYLEKGVEDGDAWAIKRLNQTVAGLSRAKLDGSLDATSVECYNEAVNRGYL